MSKNSKLPVDDSLLDQALKHHPQLSQLETAVLTKLRAAMRLHWAASSELIMQQGEPSDSLMIVLLGRVRVVQKDADGKEEELLQLGHGQTVGEIGLLTGEPRTADVVATRDSLLATLSAASVQQLMDEHPLEMNRQFVQPVIQRLQAQLRGVRQINASVLSMLITPVDSAVNLPQFIDQLEQSMQAVGKTVVLHADYIETHFGRLDDEHPETEQRLTYWLGEQEATHELLIYLADGQQEAWTQRCLRQVDKLVLVADTAVSTPPANAEAIKLLQRPEAADLDRYLVLIQPDELEMPEETAVWLAALNVRHHYHLRLGRPADVARVARLLAEQGIGLVLSGASARGFAHIGVMRAVRDAGIPVDVLGGTSSGAVSSVALATEWSDETIIQKAGTGPKMRLTLPLSAMTTGHGQLQWLEEGFADLQVEDCWLPNFFPLFDLVENELLVYEQGPIAELLRAATALPGIAPPLINDHKILVDAGVVDYVPVQLMQKRPDIKTTIVIYTITSYEQKEETPYSYNGLISGWKLLWNRLNPFSKKMQYITVFEVLYRSILIGGVLTERRTREAADVSLSIDLTQFDMFDFSRIPELVSQGYEQASTQIKELNLAQKLGASD